MQYNALGTGWVLISLAFRGDFSLICFLPYVMRRPDNSREHKGVKLFAYSGMQDVGLWPLTH